ncbi:hypothetical protein NM688_g8363 [Phlebia brevispora]|uniref:Uncharacterized protein n=1 Tax=Phlebia brevispora TaxID=194682 RepID=A0ACC1RUN0_9APHY|nr:hypothetical protein NM688_g8363 [Phlebia brevispora]
MEAKSQASFAEDGFKAWGKNPRYQTWVPKREEEADVETDPLKKMAELALQNLEDVTKEASEPRELVDAMSMYTKAATGSSKRRGKR